MTKKFVCSTVLSVIGGIISSTLPPPPSLSLPFPSPSLSHNKSLIKRLAKKEKHIKSVECSLNPPLQNNNNNNKPLLLFKSIEQNMQKSVSFATFNCKCVKESWNCFMMLSNDCLAFLSIIICVLQHSKAPGY